MTSSPVDDLPGSLPHDPAPDPGSRTDDAAVEPSRDAPPEPVPHPPSDPPKVLDGWVRFRLADPAAAYQGVRLVIDSAIPLADPAFRRVDGVWQLRMRRPELARFEYQLEVSASDGVQTILDPANPATVDTAFGSRSVLELPGYRPPWWLDAPGVEAAYVPLEVTGETEEALPVTVWAPADLPADAPAPLLMAHDGPEYDLLAGLTRYCGAMVHAGLLPVHRVALLQPVQRDDWYSGSPRYLRTAVGAGLPRLRASYAVSGPVVVMGASLGGLTALLAGLRAAPEIGGVFSQSGSFFRVVRDHESVSGYRYYERIVRQVDAILRAPLTAVPLRVGMTCGALEENVSNNRDMAAALTRSGHHVTFAEVPDLHNYTAWRDGLDPHLSAVLRDCWGASG